MAAEMRRRGHEVMIVSDEADRADAATYGLAFEPWRRAPNRRVKGAADDPLDDWRRRRPPAVVRAVTSAVICGPADAYARDTLERIDAFDPDLVVTNELLFGVMAATEARGVPTAALTANVWPFPDRPETPPFGPGWGPARTPFQLRRERTARRWIAGWYDADLGGLNAARRALGLVPLDHTLDQLVSLDLAVLGTSAAFDFGDGGPGRRFMHAGRLLPEPHPTLDPDLADWMAAGEPRILVSFSTTHQGQAGVLARIIQGLSSLKARVLVTTGPAVDPAILPRAANVRAVRRASHDALMPGIDVLVSHGGHGTVIRALAQGVPVIALPMGRDHADNARRIEARGAGLILHRDAEPRRLRGAARRVLGDPRFARAAEALGAAMERDKFDRVRALRALELAARSDRKAAGPV